MSRKPPITLLYVITSTNTGGAEKALRELVRRIDRRRFQVAICSVKRPGAYAARMSAVADSFHHLNVPESAGVHAALSFIPALLRLALLMRRLRPRIVHCFLFRASMLGRLAACLCPNAAVIAAVRVQEQNAWKYLLERLTRPLVNCYTAVSDEVRNDMIKRSRVAPDEIITVYNGIACPEQPPAGPRGRSDETRIALIGRLHPQKGQAVMLKAVRMLLDAGRNVRLYLAGDGPDEQRLRRRARELGVEDAVFFTGVIDDAVAFMADIDIVVLPSLWEGMPNVLLEAMAAGRPVVASRLHGIEEILRDGESALLCEPGRAGPLAEAVMRLMDDPERAHTLARSAYAQVRSRFDIEHTAAATQALYGRILLNSSADRKD